MEEIKKLVAQFEKKHFQGYVHVTFCTSSFTWGYITFRTEMSGGPTGEFRFTSVAELIIQLEDLLRNY